MRAGNITVVGLAAFPSALRAQDCPIGYSMSVSYITVMASMTPSLEPTTTVFSTSWTTVTETVIPLNSDQAVVGSAVKAVGGEVSTPTDSPAPDSSSVSVAAPIRGSSTSPVTLGSPLHGQATFYGGNLAGGKCSFSTYTLPSGMLGTALSDSNWDNAAPCGECVSVTGPNGNNITAMIVDECPNCGENHLDLFQDAFARLADPSTGVIDTTWTPVACGISSPFSLHNKDGTSEYWFSTQVLNANLPVQSLEVSTDGGKTWQSTTRQDYNFFENAAGFGTDSVDVRVTSSTGSSVVVNAVSVASGATAMASSNFS